MNEQEQKEILEEFKPCRLCKEAFRRIRLTQFYCNECGNHFCIGEHGNFAHGVGKCVICGRPAGYHNVSDD